jgi:hypothetical protein
VKIFLAGYCFYIITQYCTATNKCLFCFFKPNWWWISVLTSSAVDHGFELGSSLTKDYKLAVAASLLKMQQQRLVWVWNQDNVTHQ